MPTARCLFCDKPLAFRCSTEWERKPVPPCPHCGGLRYVAREQVFNRELARSEDGMRVFRCSECEPDEPAPRGWQERSVVSRQRYFDKPGPYGDGFFCSLTCGHRFAVAAANAGYRLVKR